MDNQERFQERLQRINAQRGQGRVDHAGDLQQASCEPTRRSADAKPRAGSSVLASIAMTVVLLSGLAFGAMQYLPEIKAALPPSFAKAMEGAAGQPETSTLGLANASLSNASLSIVESAIAPPVAPSGPAPGSAMAALPKAPEGWVRATALDVRHPEFLPKFAAAWTVVASDSGQSLTSNGGYSDLIRFIHNFGGSAPRKEFPDAFGAAYYLHKDGSYLYVRIERFGSGQSMGADQDAWATYIYGLQFDRLQDGEVIEQTRLGTRPVLNRTKKGARLIGDALDEQNTFNLAVPIDGQTIFWAKGTAVPRVVRGLIEDVAKQVRATN